MFWHPTSSAAPHEHVEECAGARGRRVDPKGLTPLFLNKSDVQPRRPAEARSRPAASGERLRLVELGATQQEAHARLRGVGARDMRGRRVRGRAGTTEQARGGVRRRSALSRLCRTFAARFGLEFGAPRTSLTFRVRARGTNSNYCPVMLPPAAVRGAVLSLEAVSLEAVPFQAAASTAASSRAAFQTS